MGKSQLSGSEEIRGASGRNYLIRCLQECGRRQWYVGSLQGSWGAPFQSEPLARSWAVTH